MAIDLKQAEIPIVPYACNRKQENINTEGLSRVLCVVGALVSLYEAFDYGVIYGRHAFSWCGTAVGCAETSLLMIAFPTLLVTFGLLILSICQHKPASQLRLICILLLADVISVLTPLLWGLRMRWWPDGLTNIVY